MAFRIYRLTRQVHRSLSDHQHHQARSVRPSVWILYLPLAGIDIDIFPSKSRADVHIMQGLSGNAALASAVQKAIAVRYTRTP